MLKLEQAVLVEGKYDAARLTNLVDATILTTDGSRVFRDKELQNMLKRIAAAQGLIILTDSDDAGFRIRHFVTGLVGAEHVLQAYVPAVHGKEARKQAPGKEELLGVEGIADDLILQGLQTALDSAPRAPNYSAGCRPHRHYLHRSIRVGHLRHGQQRRPPPRPAGPLGSASAPEQKGTAASPEHPVHMGKSGRAN